VIYHIGGPVTTLSTPVVDKAGNIYGTIGGLRSSLCSKGGCGRAYKLVPGTKKWTYTIIHTFGSSPNDGQIPGGYIALDSAGNIYGTTSYGGDNGDGTLFKLIPGKHSYSEQTLWNFDGTDGWLPEGGVVMDSRGNLYGTTDWGGSNNSGVVFEVTP
jgi:uncharacterized repeat protein (TIGR03803 family)